jgi:hypothetical protein
VRNSISALTERNEKSDRIHVTLSKVENSAAETLRFNATDALRFTLCEVCSIKSSWIERC